MLHLGAVYVAPWAGQFLGEWRLRRPKYRSRRIHGPLIRSGSMLDIPRRILLDVLCVALGFVIFHGEHRRLACMSGNLFALCGVAFSLCVVSHSPHFEPLCALERKERHTKRCPD